jgi:hypothetical protein
MSLTFLSTEVFWVAVGTGVAALGLWLTARNGQAKEITLFLCNQHGTPERDVVCIGPDGSRCYPDEVGHVRISSQWREVSIRDSRNGDDKLTELLVFQIPKRIKRNTPVRVVLMRGEARS